MSFNECLHLISNKTGIIQKSDRLNEPFSSEFNSTSNEFQQDPFFSLVLFVITIKSIGSVIGIRRAKIWQ